MRYLHDTYVHCDDKICTCEALTLLHVFLELLLHDERNYAKSYLDMKIYRRDNTKICTSWYVWCCFYDSDFQDINAVLARVFRPYSHSSNHWSYRLYTSLTGERSTINVNWKTIDQHSMCDLIYHMRILQTVKILTKLLYNNYYFQLLYQNVL